MTVKSMTKQRAAKGAIRYLREYAKRLHFDANIHEQYQAAYPHAVNCHKKREEIREIIRVLQEEVIDGKEAES